MIADLSHIVGADHVLAGADTARWQKDWTGLYPSQPGAVVRPANTAEVAEIVRYANRTKTPIVPISGYTGLTGGGQTDGGLVLSLDRMNAIRDIRPHTRVAVVEAGVILDSLHQAADAHDMMFPLTFGARGSAMIGGCLSTNAGGSNVLRYGNTRDLCLGLEVVTPTGEVMDLMSELHKDNSGYNLKHLMIGAEGTLGIITAAVLKLVPKPGAYATAMVAAASLPAALTLLNRLQIATGGGVEAFEYMPRNYIADYKAAHPETPEPFEDAHDVNILVEIGAMSDRDADLGDDGQTVLAANLETTLASLFEEGLIADAVVAQNETQRRAMWARREAAAELAMGKANMVDTDVAVPLDKVQSFLDAMETRLAEIDPQATTAIVSHLGDGNIHYAAFPVDGSAAMKDRIREAVEDVTLSLRGSFSAEHGIGTSKLPSMTRRKDPAAVAMMRAIKAALDPNGILNPGKVIPGA